MLGAGWAGQGLHVTATDRAAMLKCPCLPQHNEGADRRVSDCSALWCRPSGPGVVGVRHLGPEQAPCLPSAW